MKNYDLLYCLLPLFAILILAIFSRISTKSWLAPNAFLSGIWSILSVIPLIVYTDFTSLKTFVSPYSLWLIFYFCFLFNLSYSFGEKSFPKFQSKKYLCADYCLYSDSPPQKNRITSWLSDRFYLSQKSKNASWTTLRFKFHYLSLFVFIFVLIALFNDWLILRFYNKNIFSLFSLSLLAELSNEASVARYNLELFPGYIRLLSFSYFFSSLLGGTLFAISGKFFFKKILSFLPFIPSLIYVLMTTAKANFLFCLVLWIGSFLGSFVILKPFKIKVFSLRALLSVAIASVVFYTWFVITAILRTGKIELLGNFYNNNIIQSKSYSYFGGYLIGLSAWIDDSLLNNQFGSDLFLGKYTFAGLFQLLGISQREAGLIQEVQTFSDFSSNVYTFFRFIIMDYGLLGSTLVFLILGFIFSFVYYLAKQKRFIFSLPLSMFYSMVLWSHTVSLLIYNTIVLSFILFLAYLSFFLTRKLVT